MDNFQPKIVAFACNCCSYAGADLAGVSRIQYPPTTRVIRVMCSARVSPMFILEALRAGVDGVLVTGCHLGDCHYASGNHRTLEKFWIVSVNLHHHDISVSGVSGLFDRIRVSVDHSRRVSSNVFTLAKKGIGADTPDVQAGIEITNTHVLGLLIFFVVFKVPESLGEGSLVDLVPGRDTVLFQFLSQLTRAHLHNVLRA